MPQPPAQPQARPGGSGAVSAPVASVSPASPQQDTQRGEGATACGPGELLLISSRRRKFCR